MLLVSGEYHSRADTMCTRFHSACAWGPAFNFDSYHTTESERYKCLGRIRVCDVTIQETYCIAARGLLLISPVSLVGGVLELMV